MEVAIAFVLTVVVASFVAWPLLAAPESSDQPGVAPQPAEQSRWDQQKREAYAAIKEAEFDHQMGKLSDADFATLQRKYREQALAAIAAIEGEQASSRSGAAGRKPSRIAYCPNCGRPAPPRANFCPGCGTGLKVLLKDAVA